MCQGLSYALPGAALGGKVVWPFLSLHGANNGMGASVVKICISFTNTRIACRNATVVSRGRFAKEETGSPPGLT